MAYTDELGTDLRVDFEGNGDVDLSLGRVSAETVEGKDNLAQALLLRLLVPQGELAVLGHPRYGSRIHELIGEPLDRENLDLLRRLVRQALRSDPRVEEVTLVTAQKRPGVPSAVDIEASVKSRTGEPVDIKVALDLG